MHFRAASEIICAAALMNYVAEASTETEILRRYLRWAASVSFTHVRASSASYLYVHWNIIGFSIPSSLDSMSFRTRHVCRKDKAKPDRFAQDWPIEHPGFLRWQSQELAFSITSFVF